MTPKLVIFDCDGTIVDSQHMIVAAMDMAFLEAGLECPTRERVLSIVGLSLPLAIARLLPEEDPQLVARMAESYRGAFHELRKRPERLEPLYPGMREAILDLARRDDLVLGIATGKSRRGVSELLEREGLDRHFTTVQTADTHPSKPHPSMIMQAMADAAASDSGTVMIGDTTFDIEMARAASVAGVGVAWGYHTVADLRRAGADSIAETSADLPTAVARLLDGEDKERP